MCAVNVTSQVTAVAWGPFHDCRASGGRSHTGEANSNLCVQPYILLHLPYFTLHLIAGLLETTHGEKSQTVITALYLTILSTFITTGQFAIYAILWLNINTPYLLTQRFLIV